MLRLICPYLGRVVELTRERERHIRQNHPEVLPRNFELMAQTLADPDEIRRDPKCPDARLFFRRFKNLRGEKNLVVAVVSTEQPVRGHWIVTALVARKPPKGEVEWKRA